MCTDNKESMLTMPYLRLLLLLSTQVQTDIIPAWSAIDLDAEEFLVYNWGTYFWNLSLLYHRAQYKYTPTSLFCMSVRNMSVRKTRKNCADSAGIKSRAKIVLKVELDFYHDRVSLWVNLQILYQLNQQISKLGIFCTEFYGKVNWGFRNYVPQLWVIRNSSASNMERSIVTALNTFNGVHIGRGLVTIVW